MDPSFCEIIFQKWNKTKHGAFVLCYKQAQK